MAGGQGTGGSACLALQTAECDGWNKSAIRGPSCVPTICLMFSRIDYVDSATVTNTLPSKLGKMRLQLPEPCNMKALEIRGQFSALPRAKENVG